MKYFGRSAIHAFKRMLDNKNEGRVLVTLPSFPAAFMLDIGQRMEALAKEENISLQYKIAQAAVDKWDVISQNRAKELGWADEKGNLTAYRNDAQSTAKGFVVLGGINHILDTASLEDFVLCDDTYIWQCSMQGSFYDWITPIVEKVVLFGDNKKDITKIEAILEPLRHAPTGGLLSISAWLDQLDLSHCEDVESIIDTMLKNLECFALPNCIGFARKGKASSNLHTYLQFASSFFDYESFMTEQKRQKACQAVETFRELCREGESPKVIAILEHSEELFPGYDEVDAFLTDMTLYISERNAEAKERLRKCDIVTIKDHILRNSKKDSKLPSPPSKDKTSSLHGPLIENLLCAIWETCGEWRKTKLQPDADIASITLTGETYSYAKDEVDEDGIVLAAEASELAYEQLSHLIKGVDDLMVQRLGDLRNLDDDNVEIYSSLLAENLEFKAISKAPRLRFSIALCPTNKEYPSFTRYFEWIIPESNEERLNVEFLQQAYKEIEEKSNFLPIYHLNYYDEILASTDEQDTREIVRHSLQSSTGGVPFAVDIMQECEDINLRSATNQLSRAYANFLKIATEHSLYYALFHEEHGHTKSQLLHDSFCKVLEMVTDSSAKGTCDFSHVFMRAFLVIQKREHLNYHNLDSYEPSGIVTVLHPALLEQLEARTVFLFSSFIFAYKTCLDSKEKAFATSLWRRYVSLAAMQMPLFGLLEDAHNTPTTKVRGYGCIHKIGEIIQTTPSTLSTRLYSADEKQEERISEKQLFQMSAESSLFEHFLRQYFNLRSHVWDGISIAVYRNQDIQPVIAGVHAYLRWLSEENSEKNEADVLDKYALNPERKYPYDVRIVFFTDSRDATDLRAWLSLWQDCWENALSDSVTASTKFYRYCNLSISHRFAKNIEGMKNIVSKEDFDVDISILYGVTGFETAVSEFVKVAPFDVTSSALKFPILEKKYSPSREDVELLKRSRIVSHRQFRVASAHAQLLYTLSKKENADSILLTSKGDFTPHKAVIAKLHEKSEWIICVDPAIDEELIRTSATESPRNIIAFGSGVGTHGEANYTISTEQLSFKDIQGHLQKSIESLYAGYGVQQNYEKMVSNLLNVEGLSGMGLIKATSLRNYFIHDFFAMALSRCFLQEKEDNLFCDLIVSLDAYKHWFNFIDDKSRPDLFWITGEEKDGELHLKVRLVECKLGKNNLTAVKKAHAQLKNGIEILQSHFKPRSNDCIDDDRPDRRYWWNQLHRIVTSRLKAKDRAEAQLQVELLEKLAEGIFHIQWEALLLTYWVDSTAEKIRHINSWAIGLVPAHHIEIGRKSQLALAQGEEGASVIWSEFVTNLDSNVIFDATTVCEDDICTPEDSVDVFEDGYDDFEDKDDWEKESVPFADTSLESKEQLQRELEELIEDITPVSTCAGKGDDFSATEGFELVVSEDNSEHTEEDVEINSVEHISSPEKDDIETFIIPEKILLGKTKDGPEGKAVYWDFKNATNRHLLIFGSSGNGKTYAIQCILAELARAGLSPLVLDYSQSFTPDEIQPRALKYFPEDAQRFIAQSPLPINPFQPLSFFAGTGVLSEKSHNIASRVAAIFKNVYKLGTQQVNSLTDAITLGIDEERENFNLESLLIHLESFIDDGRHQKSSVQTVLGHLANFARENPFVTKDASNEDIGWNTIFSSTEAKNNVFQLLSLAPHMAAAIIEFVLWDLFAYVQRNKSKEIPKIVVLDEIQNLSLDDNSPVGKYLREGRKFGLGLIAATQSFAGVKYALSTLNQSAYKLYFRPADNELSEFGKLLHDVDPSRSATDWRKLLSQLGKGECFLVGGKTSLGRPSICRVKITAMEERGFEN